jgi:putative spermidine/putrescine transport system permease protein
MRLVHRFKQTWLLYPALALLVLFFILPTLDVVRASVFDPEFTLKHLERFFTRSVYVEVVLRTVRVAVVVAVLCTLVGYPAAYFISSRPRQQQFPLMFLVFVTMWTSVLIRSYAWIAVLGREGLVNTLMMALGLVNGPQKLLYTSTTVVVAMVQIMLPLQIVTCYGAMVEIDRGLLKAARVLGARPWQAFVQVYLPLSMDGVRTAALIVFMLAMGFFITPALLGGRGDLLLGNLIEQQVGQLEWGFASAMALVLLLVTLGSIGLAKGLHRASRHIYRSWR